MCRCTKIKYTYSSTNHSDAAVTLLLCFASIINNNTSINDNNSHEDDKISKTHGYVDHTLFGPGHKDR